MLPRCIPAGDGPLMVGLEPSPEPTELNGLLLALLREGEWAGGEAPVTLSDLVTIWVRGEVWGMFSAVGCSVPMVVTPVSLAFPALERA